MRKVNQRMKYILMLLMVLCIEVLIALYVHDAFVRPYVGDMLVVVVLYFFIKSVIPTKCNWLPLAIFIFAVGVEGLQYFRLVERLGVQDNVFLRTLLGATFDWKDILCYGIGCLVIALCEMFNAKKAVKRHGRNDFSLFK